MSNPRGVTQDVIDVTITALKNMTLQQLMLVDVTMRDRTQALREAELGKPKPRPTVSVGAKGTLVGLRYPYNGLDAEVDQVLKTKLRVKIRKLFGNDGEFEFVRVPGTCFVPTP
jgi:hypothetical protein